MRRHRVSWHKSRRWRFSTTDPGGKRRYHYATPEFPRTETGRRKATEWMEAMLRSLEDRVVQADGWTLEDLRKLYLDHVDTRLAAGEAAPETYDGHRKALNLICGTPRGGLTYGHLEARTLTTKDVGDLVKLWTGKSPTTIRNRIGSLQAMLNWAARPIPGRPLERIITANPIAGMDLPRPEYQGDRYAPAAEVEAFVGWVEARAAKVESKEARFERMLAVLIRMAAETGARPKELCRLEWRHYDADIGFVIFPPREHKTGRKTGRPRSIYIPQTIAALLEQLKSDPDRHLTHVFTHRRHVLGTVGTAQQCRQGEPWIPNGLCKRMASLRREAIEAGAIPAVDKGIKRMHLYRLRHTKITNDIQSGESITDLAGMHGNSVAIIESTYLHTQLRHRSEVGRRLERRKTSPGS